jgi:hypothetical protein
MGKRSDFERHPRGLYPTPESAVQPLLPHLPPAVHFDEPCAGDGALVRHLEAAGHSLGTASDIEPMAHGILKYDARSIGQCNGDLFITNPPWPEPNRRGDASHQVVTNLFNSPQSGGTKSNPTLPVMPPADTAGASQKGNAMSYQYRTPNRKSDTREYDITLGDEAWKSSIGLPYPEGSYGWKEAPSVAQIADRMQSEVWGYPLLLDLLRDLLNDGMEEAISYICKSHLEAGTPISHDEFESIVHGDDFRKDLAPKVFLFLSHHLRNEGLWFVIAGVKQAFEPALNEKRAAKTQEYGQD